MITGIGVTSLNKHLSTVKDADKRAAAHVSCSRNAGRKMPKRVNYNMRQISARILKCKTSGSARMALTGARGKVAQLKRQLNDYGIDRYELEHAIVHATKIMRVAKKKLKHLQEEEAAKKGGACAGEQADMEEELEEQLFEDTADAKAANEHGDDTTQEIMRDLQQEIQREMMKAMQEELQQMVQETIEEGGLGDLAKELGASFSADMDPEDLEAMKKKHRSEELKDILEADMKYLKAVFNKLQKEKEAGASIASAYANAMSDVGGVSLELCGAEIPVDAAASPDMAVVAQGANIDYMA